MWQPRLVETARLKYLGIVEALEADIRSGHVLPGERLPSQRAIAEAVGVDLTTVTRAFNEAHRRGLITAQAGRGSFVSEDPGGNQPAPVLDLSMNIAPQPARPDFRRLLPQGIAQLLGGARGLLSLHYQESRGTGADRMAAAAWLGARMRQPSAERVLVTAGAQAALFAVLHLLTRPGDAIAAGELTYPGLRAAAQQCGLRVMPLAMDAQGIIPDSFARLCRDGAPVALYLIPSIDNPTTASLPETRRRRIVELAREHGVTIIEDDPYEPLRSQHLPALADLAPAITWHIATLSKCATAALRVAYVVAPTPPDALRLAAVLRATVMMAPPMLAALARSWMVDGSLQALTDAIRDENRARQALAARIFAGLDHEAAPEGQHIWMRLPDHWRAGDLAEYADRAGISIVPASAFGTAPPRHEAVRISLGVAPDRELLEEGLNLLASLIALPSMGARAVV